MQSMTTQIKARPDFGAIIYRAGKTRTALMRASGVAQSTIDQLALLEKYSRSGKVRPATAWSIAKGWATLTGQTEEAAFEQLFVEEDTNNE